MLKRHKKILRFNIFVLILSYDYSFIKNILHAYL